MISPDRGTLIERFQQMPEAALAFDNARSGKTQADQALKGYVELFGSALLDSGRSDLKADHPAMQLAPLFTEEDRDVMRTLTPKGLANAEFSTDRDLRDRQVALRKRVVLLRADERLYGLPTTSEGARLRIGHGPWEVVETCFDYAFSKPRVKPGDMDSATVFARFRGANVETIELERDTQIDAELELRIPTQIVFSRTNGSKTRPEWIVVTATLNRSRATCVALD